MAGPNDKAERRVNPELREIFADVYESIVPFFDPKNNWGGRTHEHLAYRTLHERFPDLTGEEVFIVVSAAKRLFASGGKPASGK